MPVVVVDLRDGTADTHRLCARCGVKDMVPAHQDETNRPD
jgi:hypothetical protein